jgi:hypothetical protein
MEVLELKLQRQKNTSLYALIYLTTVLAISVWLESCSARSAVKTNSIPDIALINRAI